MTFAEQPLAADHVDAVTSRLVRQGYASIVTGALTAAHQPPFTARGYLSERSLVLLTHDLTELTAPVRPTRRSWAVERPQLLRLDADAFDSFWSFDEVAFVDALRATPATRLRVTGGRSPVAYAISGVAGRIGYLQRVAVSPAQHRGGHGQALTADALTWMARRGARRALVNTQEDNVAALGLYERLGFVRDAEPMAVLRFGAPLGG